MQRLSVRFLGVRRWSRQFCAHGPRHILRMRAGGKSAQAAEASEVWAYLRPLVMAIASRQFFNEPGANCLYIHR